MCFFLYFNIDAVPNGIFSPWKKSILFICSNQMQSKKKMLKKFVLYVLQLRVCALAERSAKILNEKITLLNKVCLFYFIFYSLVRSLATLVFSFFLSFFNQANRKKIVRSLCNMSNVWGGRMDDETRLFRTQNMENLFIYLFK